MICERDYIHIQDEYTVHVKQTKSQFKSRKKETNRSNYKLCLDLELKGHHMQSNTSFSASVFLVLLPISNMMFDMGGPEKKSLPHFYTMRRRRGSALHKHCPWPPRCKLAMTHLHYDIIESLTQKSYKFLNLPMAV